MKLWLQNEQKSLTDFESISDLFDHLGAAETLDVIMANSCLFIHLAVIK